MKSHSALTLVLLIVANSAAADRWPDFHGPQFDGTVSGVNIPLQWSETDNIKWKSPIPGRGWSTPVVVENLLWMTTAENEGRLLLALGVERDTGKLKRRLELFSVDKPEACNAMNSYASPSPVSDGRNVYFSFGTYGAAAVDAKTGRLVWSRDDLNLDHQEGPGSSPLLYKDRLVLHCDGRDQQYVVALETATGKTAWQRKRSLDLSKVGDYARKAFTTPLLVKVKGQDRIVSPAAQGCYCYDPETGKEIWSLRYPGFSAVPRPVSSNGVAFVVDGFANPSVYAVKINGQNDITDSNIKWIFKRSGPSTTSPVKMFNQLVFVTDNGVLVSLNRETGKAQWRKRIGGKFCASPIATGDLVYLFDRDGKSSVVKINADGKEPQIVARNQLAEGMMASPIAVGKSLFLRTKSHLYRVEED